MKKRLSLLFLSCMTLWCTAANNTDRGYFTMVIFGDPHISQNNCTTVAEMQEYIKNVINMGKDGGAKFTFSRAPRGFIPRADIVFCLGDMDKDSETSGNDFKTAFQGLNDAKIPFVTICGNHDLVPDYWNGGDIGLTIGSSGGGACNDVALNLVSEQYETAIKNGLEDASRIVNDQNCVETRPLVFSFHGVRFYVAQTYWFQKPYSAPYIFNSNGTVYAPDGVIDRLAEYVEKHLDEPAVWMQHYPFVAGSDNDRWWTDANSSGQVREPSNGTVYKTVAQKKDKIAELIAKTKNPYHFSGHYHYYSSDTYTSTTNTKNKVKDYVVAAPFTTKGAAYIVLLKEGEGIREVKQVSFATDAITTVVEPLNVGTYYNIVNCETGLFLNQEGNRTENAATITKSSSTNDNQYFQVLASDEVGKYYLKTPDDYYLGSRSYYTTSYATQPTKENLFTFENIGGRYLIHSVANNGGSDCLGLDATDEGSIVYTNKTSANHAEWAMASSVKTFTGIEDVMHDATNDDMPMYNVMGQRVTKDYRGIVIQNGKKRFKK